MDSEQDTDKSMDITSSQVSSGHEDSFSQLYILVESPSESKSTNNTNNESTVIDSRCQEIADVEETGNINNSSFIIIIFTLLNLYRNGLKFFSKD